MSKLLYGICAWGCVSGIPGQMNDYRAGFSKRDLLRIQALQNRAVRLVHFRDTSISTRELLKEVNQLSVNQNIAYHILLQTYKIKSSQQPAYHFKRLFSPENRYTRTRSETIIRRVDFRLNKGRSLFFYLSSKLWSPLP